MQGLKRGVDPAVYKKSGAGFTSHADQALETAAAVAASSGSKTAWSLRTQGGFTLVETFVAITILTVAIVGPMTIAARGLQSAFFAKEQITAVYLGQEAVEFVRAMRDQAALAGEPWLAQIPASCSTASGCGIDVRDGSFRDCVTPTDCQLRYDAGPLAGERGFYTYDAGDATPFTRIVRVVETVPDREAEITVTISWTSSLYPKTITVQSLILNQYDTL